MADDLDHGPIKRSPALRVKWMTSSDTRRDCTAFPTQLRSAASPNERGSTMRFSSAKTGPYQVLAVSGTNTISFAIAAAKAGTKGLLGFAVERRIPRRSRIHAFGFKVFPSVIPKPDDEDQGEDVRPSRAELRVGRLHRQARPRIRVPLPSAQGHAEEPRPQRASRSRSRCGPSRCSRRLEHDIFFNRGVASSQAYAREFDNKKPDQLDGAKRKRALQWLSRDLDEAMLKFIDNAKTGDTLLVLLLRVPLPAGRRGAQGGDRSRRGRAADHRREGQRARTRTARSTRAFPRDDNLAMIKKAGLPKASVVPARGASQRHRAQQVHGAAKGQPKTPTEVWTGSTNISDGGIHGQTNVGHWVREATSRERSRPTGSCCRPIRAPRRR